MAWLMDGWVLNNLTQMAWISGVTYVEDEQIRPASELRRLQTEHRKQKDQDNTAGEVNSGIHNVSD